MSCSNLLCRCEGLCPEHRDPGFDLADPITSGNFDSSGFTYQTSSPGYTVLVRAFYQWPLFVTGLGYNIAILAAAPATAAGC